MDLSRLACKILERVRDFRSNFTWDAAKAASPKRKKPAAQKAAAKVYHRQPTKPSPKRATSKAKTSRGRATAKK